MGRTVVRGAQDPNDLSSMRSVLLSHPSTAKFSVALAAAEGAGKTFKKLKGEYRDRFLYAVSIDERDAIYQDVHAWILKALPEQKHRKIKVATGRPDDDSPSDGGSSTRAPSRLRVYFDDSSEQRATVDGHRVKIHVIKPDMANSRDRWEPSTIRFEMTSLAAQKAVIKLIDKINASRDNRKPSLKMIGRWGDSWETRSDLPARSMDSVVLPAEQKQSLIDDLRSFLDNEKFYVDRALPYHRGYMFHGPPGTGKTSLAKALANYFNLDLWCISLTELREESSLMALISQVSPGSVLLLEDIDSAPGVRRRDENDEINDKALSPQALLNALDGVGTPHGLITFMTTNHFEWLDEAMTRSGRMDRIELIDRPSVVEIAGLLTHFYREPVSVDRLGDIVDDTLSQAKVSEICKRNMYDLEATIAELKNLSE